jgi:hypothetical protein
VQIIDIFLLSFCMMFPQNIVRVFCKDLLASAVILFILIFLTILLELQNGWCDSMGSVEDIQAKLLKRQEAAVKRERAMAYALTHQVI